MFELAIFTDDISQELPHALDVVQELGVSWVEIRSAWHSNLVNHSDKQLIKIHNAIAARGLRVPCVAAPLLKARLKGRGEVSHELFHAKEQDSWQEQLHVFKRAVHIARLFDTKLVRCFSFWRLGDDPTPIWDDLVAAFAEIVQLAEAADIILVMENDFECNLGSGAQAAKLIETIDSPHLRLLWDPGNAFFVGETAVPDGYERCKHLIGHIHLKDGVRDLQTGQTRWVALGSGEVDLLSQLRALKAANHQGVLTMENHYTPENSTPEAGVRESFAGLQSLIAELT